MDLLLIDRTTAKNIIWATDNYKNRGQEYEFDKPILKDLITGNNGDVIMPRVKKNRELQKNRSKSMAEVFTPSWICNKQNNLVDNAWFEREGVFNVEGEKQIF